MTPGGAESYILISDPPQPKKRHYTFIHTCLSAFREHGGRRNTEQEKRMLGGHDDDRGENARFHSYMLHCLSLQHQTTHRNSAV